VDGEKVWTSGAHRADWMFCLTRTSDEPKRQAGITFLLLDMRATGVTVHPIISIDGRHMFNRVTLDGVRVPLENRVGREGEGWTVAKGLLTHERTGQAFVSLSTDLSRRIREAGQAQEGAVDDDRLGADFLVEQRLEDRRRPPPLQRHAQALGLQAGRVGPGLMEGLERVDDVLARRREGLGEKAEAFELLAARRLKKFLDLGGPEVPRQAEAAQIDEAAVQPQQPRQDLVIGLGK
jgi:hypothetical protein